MWDEIIRIAKSDSLIFVALWLMVLGSIVDIWQFGFGVRRWWRKRERKVEARIRAKLIVEEFDRRKAETQAHPNN